MKIKDRIKELRRVPANQLLPNPKNWRRHPESQMNALRGVLAEVGYADAVLARETPDGLMLIDGHLRAETVGAEPIPVLVLDVNEAEADLILATLDPLAGMAQTDGEALTDLIATLEIQSEAINEMLRALVEENGIFDVQAGEMPVLPTGDKSDHEQITFSLSTEQAETVREALDKSKDMGDFGDTGNENTNGNALARLCEVYLGQS